MATETPAADIMSIQLVARFVASLTSNGANREHLLTINHDEIAAIVRDAQEALYRNPAAADEITRLRADNIELRRKLRVERLKPCRHTTPSEQKVERPDLVAWQTAQSEWFDATILSIVEEYAGWRDKRDAELQRKLGEAVKALEFYAGLDPWGIDSKDFGDRASAALASIRGEPQT